MKQVIKRWKMLPDHLLKVAVIIGSQLSMLGCNGTGSIVLVGIPPTSCGSISDLCFLNIVCQEQSLGNFSTGGQNVGNSCVEQMPNSSVDVLLFSVLPCWDLNRYFISPYPDLP
jgi:hypothetical protein